MGEFILDENTTQPSKYLSFGGEGSEWESNFRVDV